MEIEVRESRDGDNFDMENMIGIFVPDEDGHPEEILTLPIEEAEKLGNDLIGFCIAKEIKEERTQKGNKEKVEGGK